MIARNIREADDRMLSVQEIKNLIAEHEAWLKEGDITEKPIIEVIARMAALDNLELLLYSVGELKGEPIEINNTGYYYLRTENEEPTVDRSKH